MKSPLGRPKTRTTYDPPRQLGRVSAVAWAELQAAARRSGQSFTQWAVTILLKAARRSRQ